MAKNRQPPPDYAPLAEASRHAAELADRLGRDQLDFARRQYEEQAPILRGIAETQIEAQREQTRQGREHYAYLRDTFRPLERGLVADAREFGTKGWRERFAAAAAADAGRSQSLARAADERGLASMGVNPNSGRFAGTRAATGLREAAARAAASTGARLQAERFGHERGLAAAQLGRGLAGASTAAYAGGVGAGSQAGLNSQSAGQGYLGNMAQGAATSLAGRQAQIQGLSSVLNTQAQTYANSGSLLGDIGGILGGAASVYKAFS